MIDSEPGLEHEKCWEAAHRYRSRFRTLPPRTAIRSAGRRIQPGKRTQPGAGPPGRTQPAIRGAGAGHQRTAGQSRSTRRAHALEKVVYGEALTAEDAAAILSDGKATEIYNRLTERPWRRSTAWNRSWTRKTGTTAW